MGYQYKFDIAGVEHGMTDVQSAKLTAPLFDKLSVGNVCSAELDITFWPVDTVPIMAQITPYIQRKDGTWYKIGDFWTDTRKKAGTALSIVSYDAMMRGEEEWIPDQSLEFPMIMPKAVIILAALMGLEIDDRTVLNSAYTIDYPANEQTIRQTLGYIAAAHAGNWVITNEGKLRLVPLFADTGKEFDVGRKVSSVEFYDEVDPISGIALVVDSENEYRSGDETGYVLEVVCPYGTQVMADNILASVAGKTYVGYRAQAAVLDPEAELGDGITVDGVSSFLAYRRVNFGPAYMSEIAAPGESILIHEYGYKSPTQQSIDRQKAETYSLIQKTSENILLKVANDLEGMSSEIDMKMDSISLSVSSTAGADGKVYSSITLKVGENMYTGQILMEGNIDISGQLSADALYSAMGSIADLTVDKLSTSRRVIKYLARDTSDDNYIIAQDEILAFMSGVYAEGTEQATTPHGTPIYWESDPDAEGVTLGTDGYPYLDGVRIFTTTAETPWPVLIYTYTELTKAKMAFEQLDDLYAPVLTLGAGDGTGYNQGFLHKTKDSLHLTYVAAGGKEIGVRMGYDGYTDIAGVRKTTDLNFSNWDYGNFYETVDGDETKHRYAVEFDSQKRPIKITDSDGHEMSITW